MDVNAISNAQSSMMMNAYQAGAAKKTANADAPADAKAEDAAGKQDTAAYSVNISDAAKEAHKAANQGKGISAEDVRALQADVEQKSLQFMIDLLSANNEKLQGYLDDGIGKLNFNGVEIDTSRCAMPEVATNPEDAKAAISEGGDWSVSAVSDRIFGLASAIAGDNPEMLEKMRGAVEEGFKQAGIAFKDVFGKSDMPQITKDTYAEIMNRFDTRAQELGGAATAAEA